MISAMFVVMHRKATLSLTFNFVFFLAIGCLTSVSSQCKINSDCKNGYCRSGMCICNRGWWGSLCEFCRLRLSEDSGIITDGDGIYSASSKCSWLIESRSPNSTIHLNFEEFATECNWDHLYVYDGKSIKSPLIGVISGLIRDKEKPNYADGQVLKLQANSGAAFLYFYSDRHYFENGFKIKYSVSKDCSAKCSYHGHCNKDENCTCDKGWAGLNCNIQTCFEECVNGYCDNTTRLCICNPGFSGPSCNFSGERALWVHHSPKGQELIQGRASHASALLGDYMWVFGGYSFHTEPFADILRYHIPSDSWEVVSPAVNCTEVPSRRYAHTMIAYNTSLYVFGGRVNQKATNELWLFDTQTLCWTLLANKGDSPLAVAGHTATLVNAKMIVLFGYGPQRGFTDKVQEYNLETGRWSVHRVPTDIIRPSYGHSTAYHPVHNLLYVLGGFYESNKLATDLTSYNPVTRKWKALKGIGVPRFHHTAVFLGDVMLVFGGNSHNGTLGTQSQQPCFATDFTAYDIACDEWKTIPYSGNLKSSGRYGHSALLVNRSMYVFGGFQGVLLSDVLSFTPGPCDLIRDRATCQMHYNSSDCVWSDSSSTCLGPERCITPPVKAEDKCKEFERSCKRCRSALQGCSWCGGICVKGDCSAKTVKIDSPGKCQKGELDRVTCQGVCKELDCFKWNSCDDCVKKSTCMWCESQKQCVAPNAYPISFPYGQCRSWVQRQCSSVRCSQFKTCDDCHTLPGCGWCDDGSSTGLGKCMEGGDNGPFTKSTSSASQCPVHRWYFIECPDCQCNGHSKCINRNICEKCQNNTSGHRCDFCAVRYYGDAKNGGTCKACKCNGHANTCDHETGKCKCLAHWVTGDHCESCSDERDIVGNATNGGRCYKRLQSGYEYTFNVSNQTSIAFLFIPTRDDGDVTVEVYITSEGTFAFLNVSISSDLFPEDTVFYDKKIGHFRKTFSHKDYRFGGGDRLTFKVVVFDIQEFTTFKISFEHKQKFSLLSFFITFFACFFSLLFVVGLAWKIKVRYSRYMMARHRVEEMKVMASRPFARVCLSFTDPEQESLNKCQKPSPAIAVQPMENHSAALGVFMMRLPGQSDGYTPIGQTGICCATTLGTYGGSTHQSHPLHVTGRTAIKRSSMIRVCCT